MDFITINYVTFFLMNRKKFDFERWKGLILWIIVLFVTGSLLTLSIMLTSWDMAPDTNRLLLNKTSNADFSGILIDSSIISINWSAYKFKIHFNFQPVGDYARNQSKENRDLAEKVFGYLF